MLGEMLVRIFRSGCATNRMTDLRLKRRLVDGEESDETRQEVIVVAL
jgi:hypothetical protein